MFSRNRYQNILKFLPLVDKKKIPKRNDLSYKPSLRFKPLIDFANRKFLHYYNPRRELSVDESLVGTKGKTSMLQYIPSKRSRFGVKFWMLVESVTGYVLYPCWNTTRNERSYESDEGFATSRKRVSCFRRQLLFLVKFSQ